MTTIEVRTRSELDAALDTAKAYDLIAIVGGSWLEVSRLPKNDSATVTASCSATVTASGSATVTASDSATVTASDSATVRASGSATVTASGSATVTASGSATVRASDSATVTASDSATVTASDSATVTASGSATVTASCSATVRAYGSATVRASGSATVRASKFVAVHRRSRGVTITGGVQIDAGDLDTSLAWCEYHGVPVVDGIATLHKALDDDLSTDNARRRGITYVPGTTVDALDWKPTKACGNGLHACAHPHQALGYNSGATRFVAVTAPVASLVVIDDGKVKAPRFTVAGEVDIHGRPKAGPIPAPKAKRTRKAAK